MPVVSENRTVAANSAKLTKPKRKATPASFKPGVSGNPVGRPPLTEAQRLARSMRAQAQPELVRVLLDIAIKAVDPKDRIAAAKALIEEVPPVDSEGIAAALTVVIRRQGGE